MQLFKTLISKLMIILICIFLFILYVILDRKYYKNLKTHESFKLNTNFNLVGESTNTKYGALAYDDLSISFEDISNNFGSELKTLVISGRPTLTNEDIAQLQNTISNESNKKFYNIDALRKDFRYFNNATHLMHANNINTNEYPYDS
tara:strand:- start:5 stop:445 length:441 start_codon:yes stop_codon:yes gene_type:complete